MFVTSPSKVNGSHYVKSSCILYLVCATSGVFHDFTPFPTGDGWVGGVGANTLQLISNDGAPELSLDHNNPSSRMQMLI